jgi:ribosome-binding protein aMBF1 (putative translation factor)
MKLGPVIEAYRKSRGVSYRTLAKEMKVDHAVLFRVVGGKSCDLETWSLIYAWMVGK